MKRTCPTSRIALGLGLSLLLACTTGTDVDDTTISATDQARLDRIAQLAHQLVDDAKKQPQKPASELVTALTKIMREAETP